MEEPFIGSDAVAAGRLTPYQLRSKFVAVHRDVYVARDCRLTAAARANAAWLWSGRACVIAGRSAALLHGAKWVDDAAPAEILYDNRRPPRGISTWSDQVAEDEIETIRGVAVTMPARTALDLACHRPLDVAVAEIDALARAAKLKVADVELIAERHQGRRGIRGARTALDLVDPGAESPRETWLRLLLIGAGFPRPETQIPVYDEYGQLVAELDMGWRDIKVAAEYDGDHHWKLVRQLERDIRRYEAVTQQGWIDVRVTKADTEGAIIGRVARAFEQRT
ncbi:MAG: hypothetical protein JWP55_2929 [Mycobacterium sp.]|jgi:hypothetical protein|nr:hypothetical protein [Mycobacterium sp.]